MNNFKSRKFFLANFAITSSLLIHIITMFVNKEIDNSSIYMLISSITIAYLGANTGSKYICKGDSNENIE